MNKIDRLHLIIPALQAPRGSSERARAVEAAQLAANVTNTTVYLWIRTYESKGVGALERIGLYVHVSKKWDSGVPFDEATKAWIGAEMRAACCTLWRIADDKDGHRKIGRVASRYLQILTNRAGFKGDFDTLQQLCALPDDFVLRDRSKYREPNGERT